MSETLTRKFVSSFLSQRSERVLRAAVLCVFTQSFHAKQGENATGTLGVTGKQKEYLVRGDELCNRVQEVTG